MSSTTKKISLVLLLLIAGSAVYFVFFKSPVQDSTPVAEAPAVQESVYLPLTDLTGKEVAMDENKISFVNVWATWCGPCNMEMPGIQTLYNKYKDHNKIAFYIISDEDAQTVNPFIARKGYNLPFYQYAGPTLRRSTAMLFRGRTLYIRAKSLHRKLVLRNGTGRK
jgi:thiol-disulfide isomerase/thioredoxin